MAWRRLRSAPVFTIFAVLTLGVGIGTTTAIYSVIDAALLTPPHIKDIDRVVNLYHSSPATGSFYSFAFSRLDYEDLRAAQTSFSEVAAWSRFRETLVASGSGEVVLGEMVSAEYFRLMGVEAALGRTIDASDERADAAPVIVLSDATWRRRFAADPQVLGTTARLNGTAFVIIGVAPAMFRGVDIPNIVPSAAWVPLRAADRLSRSEVNNRTDRSRRSLLVKARLKPGTSVSAAATELAAIGRQLDEAYPLRTDREVSARTPPADVSRRWVAIPTADVMMHESIHRVAAPMAATVLVIVTLVLLVACTNIANLVLAHGTSRRHELAVRLSLGASRRRLIGEELVEGALICAAGAAVSLVIARALGVFVLSRPLPMAPGIAIQVIPSMNGAVALVGLAATMLAFLIFSLGPAWHLTRGQLHQALALDNGSGALPRWRGRRLLITGQVAVSVALVAIAGLQVQQLVLSARHDSGIDLERLAIVRLDFKMQNQEEDRARATLRLIVDRARLERGLEAVAVSTGLPFGSSALRVSVTTPDRPLDANGVGGHYAPLLAATPEVFSVLGVDLRGGRPFEDRDDASTEPVAIVSERLARALFGGIDVLGREILTRAPRMSGEAAPPTVSRTIVGVAADTDSGVIGTQSSGVAYVPFDQDYTPNVMVVARTSTDPAPLVGRLREVVARVDPELAIFDAGTGPIVAGAINWPLQISAGLSGILGIVALALAMSGLYGVLSYLVWRRTPEIGVRRALGATTPRIMRLVILDGLRPVVDGLIVGVALAAVARLAISPLFRRLTPAIDPFVVGGVAALFLVAALVAAYLPARRAARVDPNVALRQL